MTATRLMPNTVQDWVQGKSISQMADDQVSVRYRCRSLLTCPFWPLQGLKNTTSIGSKSAFF